ncbi:MAG: MoxR family ATPase, partial [Dehalococcoidia bacterium]
MAHLYARVDEGDETIDAAGFQRRFEALLANVTQVVVASERTVYLALLGLFAEGHVLVEDSPGVGKTLLAKTIAQSIDGEFTRVQFTPDLLPSDITGSSVYNPQTGQFDFMPGPIFANVLLADELNRTNPRTQSALLEAMAEGQVTVDGASRPLHPPFMVIATQNPMDSSGTFPLPETELDRFLVRISIGMPSSDDEMEILLRSEHEQPEVAPVLTCADVRAMQALVRRVRVTVPVKEYLIRLAGFIRAHADVRRGVSPRGTVLLQRASQGWAAFQGRDFATPDDVQAVASSVLAHRITVEGQQASQAQAVVQEALESV